MSGDQTKSALRTAVDVVEQRRAVYGPPILNFQRIADLWTVALGPVLKLGARLTPAHVAQLNRLQKEARLVETPDHRDSLIDIAGYVDCAEQVQMLEDELRQETFGPLDIGDAVLAANKGGSGLTVNPSLRRCSRDWDLNKNEDQEK